MPEIAQLLVDAMLHRQGHFQLDAYIIMANHVHVLITPRAEVSVLMHSLKRFTARKANQILGLTGHPFWQEESYDRWIRNDEEMNRIIR